MKIKSPGNTEVKAPRWFGSHVDLKPDEMQSLGSYSELSPQVRKGHSAQRPQHHRKPRSRSSSRHVQSVVWDGDGGGRSWRGARMGGDLHTQL